MNRYVVLLKFTEKGLANIAQSASRADAFRENAAKTGSKVLGQYWTIGPYDGALVLEAPDEETAAGIVLGLGKADNVSTCMLRAFNESEFKHVLAKLG